MPREKSKMTAGRLRSVCIQHDSRRHRRMIESRPPVVGQDELSMNRNDAEAVQFPQMCGRGVLGPSGVSIVLIFLEAGDEGGDLASRFVELNQQEVQK
jgi:hypothetical protein